MNTARYAGGKVQKKCQVAAAKEVGMGNPAEKNDRSPDAFIVGDHPTLARNFSNKFGNAQRGSVVFSDTSTGARDCLIYGRLVSPMR